MLWLWGGLLVEAIKIKLTYGYFDRYDQEWKDHFIGMAIPSIIELIISVYILILIINA